MVFFHAPCNIGNLPLTASFGTIVIFSWFYPAFDNSLIRTDFSVPWVYELTDVHCTRLAFQKINILNNFVRVTFCPVTFCSCDILSVWHFVRVTFCPWDIMSVWHFVRGTLCPVAFCPWDVMSCGILSVGRYVLWHFVLGHCVLGHSVLHPTISSGSST